MPALQLSIPPMLPAGVCAQVGPVEDAIVCKILDNPEPVVFPLSVIGAKPQVRCRQAKTLLGWLPPW